jgi:hypothetical protein
MADEEVVTLACGCRRERGRKEVLFVECRTVVCAAHRDAPHGCTVESHAKNDEDP